MKQAQAEAIPDEAQRLAESGRVEQGYRLLEKAAGQGNALAAAELACWRMAGNWIRRDLGLARQMFERAAQLGDAESRAAALALMASGAGGHPRQWQEVLKRLRAWAARDAAASEQTALLDAMDLDQEGDPRSAPKVEELSRSPLVLRVPAFLTARECDYVVAAATPRLTPSVIVHPHTGQMMQDPIRTSLGAAFPFTAEDPVLHAINRRIAKITGTRYQQGEPLQVLSYAPGQQYRLHSDALPPGANQRVITLLVYLNNDFEGGETAFPDLGISHRGGAGDAIIFANVDAAGRPEMRARHAGLAVRRGRKWLLSKWIRERPLDLSGPPGRPF
jgi:prolyl 4-hydroxylase